MSTNTASQHAQPSQDFVPIESVRDGVVILKDGSFRALLMASSLNIALKSEDEQAAIAMQFSNFLNSLDFSVQFFIQSRQLDIRPYIALLEKRYTEQGSELMKIQVREYIEFIKSFTEGTSIMTKSFFIVVPYMPPLIGAKGTGLSSLFSSNRTLSAEEMSRNFEEHRTQLEQRVSVVAQGLARTGVRVAQLGTEEVIELYYRLFNIGELERPISLTQVADSRT